ncbi:hypothetical protein CS063_03955 [Sporanaerobium hydrogeniformans]|uniref:Uncharacterized protein n=1 Tax=Sporanaerobium hydrogeniformans TaxID=3072179 RepID=A0AC61DFZ7_9FIRM|nr:hypothetical protein [Sporanaerobium hydrogeniformans]PHV71723.1 hypothetical protein CS063_03955 [Sporanaerobium hydrogeniformans]
MENQRHSLTVGLAYAYSHCIDRYLRALTHSLFSSLPYLDEETNNLSKEVEALFLALPTLLSESTDIKATYVEKLIHLRPVLEKKYRTLKAYERELTQLTLVFEMTALPSQEDLPFFEADLNSLHTFDFEKLAQDCTQFIFHETNLHERQSRAALLLPYLPIRLTKDNFIYYISKTLKQIHIEDTAESADFLIQILAQLFDGKKYKEYGKHFKDIATSLEEFKCLTNREDFEENRDLLEETLQGALEIVEALYEVICTLCTFFLLENSSFKALTDLHPSFYDLYYSIKAILENGEDRELFISTLPERVEEIKASLEEPFLKACKQSVPSSVFALLQTSLQMRLTHLFSFDISKKPLMHTQTESLFEDFLIQLRKDLDALPPFERKLRMQYLMSVVPFAMSKETFHTYALQAFHASKEAQPLLIAIMYLTSILEQNGFYGESTEEQHILLENDFF